MSGAHDDRPYHDTCTMSAFGTGREAVLWLTALDGDAYPRQWLLGHGQTLKAGVAIEISHHEAAGIVSVIDTLVIDAELVSIAIEVAEADIRAAITRAIPEPIEIRVLAETPLAARVECQAVILDLTLVSSDDTLFPTVHINVNTGMIDLAVVVGHALTFTQRIADAVDTYCAHRVSTGATENTSAERCALRWDIGNRTRRRPWEDARIVGDARRHSSRGAHHGFTAYVVGITAATGPHVEYQRAVLVPSAQAVTWVDLWITGLLGVGIVSVQVSVSIHIAISIAVAVGVTISVRVGVEVAVTVRRARTRRVTNAGDVIAVDDVIVVIIDAVAADLERMKRLWLVTGQEEPRDHDENRVSSQAHSLASEHVENHDASSLAVFIAVAVERAGRIYVTGALAIVNEPHVGEDRRIPISGDP